MKRNRFPLLLRFWHFADNNDVNASTDRLHKIRRIFDMVLEKFSSARSLGEDVVVDETMVPFRGRLKFKQYLPRKSQVWNKSFQTL